ncbi:hypothetical protein ZIOFF_007021 [Zingiber officinale]|uniref:HMA domain-containing protein n=1 Tax=Zingiber officinale TaxID=94328 RepID=A0A8J5LPK5_ZINOF|nr:hypothetical protein ZIOFF_007021 [Zingiber officinale]
MAGKEQKIATIIIKVDLECCCCSKKIKSTLCQLQKRFKITSIAYDAKKNTVTVSGPFNPDCFIKKLCCMAYKVLLFQAKQKIAPSPPNPISFVLYITVADLPTLAPAILAILPTLEVPAMTMSRDFIALLSHYLSTSSDPVNITPAILGFQLPSHSADHLFGHESLSDREPSSTTTEFDEYKG